MLLPETHQKHFQGVKECFIQEYTEVILQYNSGEGLSPASLAEGVQLCAVTKVSMGCAIIIHFSLDLGDL